MELLVETDSVSEVSNLQLSVDFLSSAWEVFGPQSVDNGGVVLPVGHPLVVPQKNAGCGRFGLGRPVVAHVVEELKVLFEEMEVEGPINVWGCDRGPKAMNREALAE